LANALSSTTKQFKSSPLHQAVTHQATLKDSQKLYQCQKWNVKTALASSLPCLKRVSFSYMVTLQAEIAAHLAHTPINLLCHAKSICVLVVPTENTVKSINIAM
jgi:hypothetical protein